MVQVAHLRINGSLSRIISAARVNNGQELLVVRGNFFQLGLDTSAKRKKINTR